MNVCYLTFTYPPVIWRQDNSAFSLDAVCPELTQMFSHLTFTDPILARHLRVGRANVEASDKHAIIRPCRIARSRSTFI